MLDPETEADLIERGIVFATQLTAAPPSGKPYTFLLTSKRPYAEVLNTRTPVRTTSTLSIVEG